MADSVKAAGVNALVALTDIHAARAVIGGRLHRTPMAPSTWIGEQVGARVTLKLELFQRTGSFKPRGVLNKLSSLTSNERSRGVISLSAGNHAQAVAWGASAMGIRSTIVMPAAAVRTKVDATRGYGGEVVQTDGDLLAATHELQRERDLVLVHPFDDPLIIAGAGTVGLEIGEDVADVDAVVVGCGGGGLISGIAAAIRRLNPSVRVIGVEPTGANAMTRSLVQGEPVHLSSTSTIADGLAAPFAGAHTLAHVRSLVERIVEVSDAEIVAGMRALMERCKILPEPAGAAATAALLCGRVDVRRGEHIVVVVTGGNVDLDRLKQML
ncbi:MAG TPA: threonine/serine dehydratase [Gemmatimonadaceae bacterium]|nr:threonine/serine dehydratase [Gemmatimonadaceae bacterium]